MKRWLEEFTYRIEPSLYIFLATGAGTLLVAILIASYHSIRAAMTNPVEVLKDE
jgi:ABC-type lipoprotein release transport system permease subunit